MRAAVALLTGAGLAVTITATPSKEQVLLGEPFEVVLSVSGAASAVFPEPPRGDLEPLSLEVEGLRATYRVAAFAFGEVEFPSLPVTADGVRYDSPAVAVSVVPTTGEGDAPRPLRPVPPVAPRPEFYLVVALALSAAAALAVLAARLVASRAGAGGRGAEAPSPFEEALAELAALRRGGLSQDELFTRLSALLRRYIERRHGVPALEMTSGEVVSACRALLGVDRCEALGRVLAMCDLAEFALYRFSPAEVASALDAAEDCVRSAEVPL